MTEYINLLSWLMIPFGIWAVLVFLVDRFFQGKEKQ